MRFDSRRLLVSLFAVAWLLVPRPAGAAPTAHLTLQSEDGDYIGGGGSFDITYTPSNSTFFFPIVSSLTPTPSFVTFLLGTVTGGSDNTFAILDFSTNQLGIPIQPGFYSDAQRASFAAPGHPGLDISFQNRGCNTLGGSFLVNEATFSPDGLTVDTFSAAFEQHCEEAEPALFGRFDFEANRRLPCQNQAP